MMDRTLLSTNKPQPVRILKSILYIESVENVISHVLQVMAVSYDRTVFV